MSQNHQPSSEFERQACAVLQEDVARVDSRIRSRLNQARQAAVSEAGRRPAFWRSFTFMPTAGAVAAAALVTMVLWHHQLQGSLPVAEGGQGVEDLDLLADGEALDLMEGGDGSFYEWAAEQTDVNGETSG